MTNGATGTVRAVNIRAALDVVEPEPGATRPDLAGELVVELDDAIAKIDALPLSGEAIVPHEAPKAAPADAASSAVAGEEYSVKRVHPCANEAPLPVHPNANTPNTRSPTVSRSVPRIP